MDNIEFVERPILEMLDKYHISKDRYKERFAALLSDVENYIKTLGYSSKEVFINRYSLSCMLVDYFIDVGRLKDFHQIKHINSIKIVSYISYWFLRRKPIQVVGNLDNLLYINEKFVSLYILDFLMCENCGNILDRKEKGIEVFVEQLYYYLKFRQIDQQSIEMMLISFFAGQIYQSTEKDLTSFLPESEM